MAERIKNVLAAAQLAIVGFGHPNTQSRESIKL
jgi:hypothetical protein